MNREPDKLILSVGEVVWDIFPNRKVLGGAPVNVAYHLAALGEDVRPVTRVGPDRLGEQTLEQLRDMGLSLMGVQRDEQLPTGTVKVSIDSHDEPHFNIVAPAAWDAIDLTEALRTTGEQPFQLVFGTLGQRYAISRETIGVLREKASFRYYDVNLRPPFTTRELVLDSLAVADLVKVNEHELAVIAGWLDGKKSKVGDMAADLRQRYSLSALVVTRGGDGALLAAADGVYEEEGIKITVADTVGAGDAFFAALIAGFRKGLGWQDILASANRRGAMVASCQGATPRMGELG
jgi:fructokinase